MLNYWEKGRESKAPLAPATFDSSATNFHLLKLLLNSKPAPSAPRLFPDVYLKSPSARLLVTVAYLEQVTPVYI